MFAMMLRSITRCSLCGQFGHNRRTCGSRGVSTIVPTLGGRISSRVLRLQEKQRELEEAEQVTLKTMNDEMMHLLVLVMDEIRLRFPVVTDADVFLKEIQSHVKSHSSRMSSLRTNSDRRMLLGKLIVYLELYYNRLVQADDDVFVEEEFVEEEFVEEEFVMVIPTFKTWTVKTEFQPCCNTSDCSECPVCYEQVNKKKMTTNQCGHGVCSDCLIDFIKAQQKKGVVPACVLCRVVVSKIEFCSPITYNKFLRVFPEKVSV
jgi:hypothetical protein